MTIRTTNTNTLGRAMALDIGDARIGIAISNIERTLAQPHSTLERTSNKNTNKQLIDIIKIEDVRDIILGMPLCLDGSEGDQAKRVRKFFRNLTTDLNKHDLQHVRVTLWDERYTSQEAAELITGRNLKNKERSRELDRISAAIILDDYLKATHPQ